MSSLRFTINHLRTISAVVALDLVVSTRWLVESPQFDRKSRVCYLVAFRLLVLAWLLIVNGFLRMTEERSRTSMVSMGVVWMIFLLSLLPIVARVVLLTL